MVQAAYSNLEGKDAPGILASLSKWVDSPEVVARAIVNAICKGQREVWLGHILIKLLVKMDSQMPAMMDWVFARIDPKNITRITANLGIEPNDPKSPQSVD